jgi:hypothetical protein
MLNNKPVRDCPFTRFTVTRTHERMVDQVDGVDLVDRLSASLHQSCMVLRDARAYDSLD